MRNPDEIVALYRDRKASLANLHSKMREIREIYNGRAEVPLPDMDREEKTSIPNLLQQGVDQIAGRITSVTPQVSFASKRPGMRRSDRAAADAARTVTGWWQEDRLMLKQKTRGRRLIAYAMAPVVVRWNHEEHRPTWQVRHPLETFPSPDLQPGQVSPQDCIFTYRRTAGWMNAAGYGEHIWNLAGSRASDLTRDTPVTLVEYMDKDHTVLMAVGHYAQDWTYQQYDYESDVGGLRGIVLEQYENPIDEIPVVIPTRLTLDEMTGQFDGMVGLYYQQAKLMALEVIAVEKGVFPDTYLVSRSGEMGRFIEGPYDGRTGQINVIQGGDIQTEQPQPGYMTQQTIDRLERAQRVTSGIPAEFGGESGSNIRTGRRGDAVLSATIDFPVAEAQEMFAYALQEENEIAIKYAKRFDGSTPRTLYVGTGNATRPVTYKANETFEIEDHVVSYPAVGTDVNSLIIGIGQRVGLGIMSKKTAATLDPYIDNPEMEHDLIISEGLEQALMSGLQQQAQQGALPPLVLARVMDLVKNDKLELAEALDRVMKESQKAAEEAKAAGPQAPATPETAMAGAAQQALAGGMSPIPGANQGQLDLGTLMSTLRKPAMTIQPGRNVPAGGV
jgi:hypothetical protein